MFKIKLRRHGATPANWQFRDGRPRWIPSPSLRNAGWRGRDLKDRDGSWLAKGASIDLAERINAAVAAWKAGQAVAPEFADMAPAGAAAQPGRRAADRFAIGTLIDAYAGSAGGEIPPSDEFAELAAATQRDYRGKLKRLVDVLAGYTQLPGPDAGDKARAAYAAAVADVRANSVFSLAPVGEDQELIAGQFPSMLHMAAKLLRKHAGDHQAAGVLAVASAWLAWCQEHRSQRILNYARNVSRPTPKGRIRVASLVELRALVVAAEAIDLPEVADAIVLAVDLSWSQQDLLELTWGHIKDGRARKTRTKTGAMMETPLLKLGLDRLGKIRARQDNVRPSKVVHLQRERNHSSLAADADSHFFRKLYAQVRDHAEADCPSVADLQFRDLRDTAVTIAYEAGLTEPEIASRTGHSLKQIRSILDAHYGAVSRTVADNGARKLNHHMAKGGFTL